MTVTAAGAPPVPTRVVLRPLGSPLPLGFFAFGMGVLLTGLLDLHVLPAQDARSVAVLLLTFTAPLELLAAVLAFLARDSGAATALGVFGASWVSTGVGLLLAEPGDGRPVTGAFLLGLAAILLLLAGAATKGKPALAALLVLAAVRSVLSGAYELLGAEPLQAASGWVSMLIVAVSAYGGLALLLEDGRGHLVLPTLRRGAARSALQGDLAEQLEGIESEAGVRKQL